MASNGAHAGLDRWSYAPSAIALIGGGQGSASEILRALGADPNSIRFAAKKPALPTSLPGPLGLLRGTIRAIPVELEFGVANAS